MSALVRWLPATDRFVVDDDFAALLHADGLSAADAVAMSRDLRSALLLRERIGAPVVAAASMAMRKEVA